MGKETYESDAALNRKAYEALREQIKKEYAGQYAAIAHGKLIAVAGTYDKALAAVQELQPGPEHFLVFGADDENALDPFYSY